jgi:hypothetical protein
MAGRVYIHHYTWRVLRRIGRETQVVLVATVTLLAFGRSVVQYGYKMSVQAH